MKYSILIAIVILCVPVVTSAASFEFEKSSPTRLGDTIRVPVYIDAGDESVSIALLRVKFSREMLWAKSFIPAPGWLTVPGEEYNVIDNGRGSVRAGGGFGGGVNGRVLFGTLEFVAVGSGITDVIIETDSTLLNLRNKNIATGLNTPTPRIVIASLERTPVAPTQLFDIGFQLERQIFSPEEPITLRAHFNSFGTIPTPVDMFFTVTDESGKIFATSDENLVVETDALFTKRLEHLDLPPGDYDIHMHTRYNVQVEDDFHVSFSVRRQSPPFLIVFSAIFVALFGLLIISKRHNYGHK